MARIKVIALIEARDVTGPAKNVLRFAVDQRDRVGLTAVTFRRRRGESRGENGFVSTAQRLAISVESVAERGPFDLSVLPKLREIFDKLRPDVVQTHSVKSHFLVSLLSKREFRWIAFHHGYTGENFKAHIYRQFDRWSLRQCDFIATVCQAFAGRMPMRQIQQGRVFVVPNAVKADSFQKDRTLSEATKKQLNIAPESQVVLSIGRLSPEKGHRYLIEAAWKALSARPDIKFDVLIAGRGLSEKKLKGEIARRVPGGNIRLIGHWSDVKPLFSIADVFVLPSLSEGSPNVLLESMAAGVPIAATNVGGIPDLVKHEESALLVPPKNSERLCDAMLELLGNRSRAAQMAGAAFERVNSLFSSARYDERMLNIYDIAMRS